jgi:carbonic anhydrase
LNASQEDELPHVLYTRPECHGFAERTGYDEQALAGTAVTDPAKTVRTDVERLLSAPQASPRIKVSGHVYDLETGLVSTIVAPASPVPL